MSSKRTGCPELCIFDHYSLTTYSLIALMMVWMRNVPNIWHLVPSGLVLFGNVMDVVAHACNPRNLGGWAGLVLQSSGPTSCISGNVTEPFWARAFLEEARKWGGGDHWGCRALPYFLLAFSAFCSWIKCDQSASCSSWLLTCLPHHYRLSLWNLKPK